MNEFRVRIDLNGAYYWLHPIEFEDTDVSETLEAWKGALDVVQSLRNETVFRMLDDNKPDLTGLWADLYVEREIPHRGPWSTIALVETAEEEDEPDTVVTDGPLFGGAP
jgi:hypothetical protein